MRRPHNQFKGICRYVLIFCSAWHTNLFAYYLNKDFERINKELFNREYLWSKPYSEKLKKSLLIAQSKKSKFTAIVLTEAVAPMCSVKKMLLKNSKYPQENTCAKTCNFIKKAAMAQVFSCECCEIFKNTFLYRTPPVATSILNNPKSMILSTSEIIPENFFSKQ